MNQITGLAELLDSKDLGDKQREVVDELKHSVGNLAKVITDILNYVQLGNGMPNSRTEPFSLRTTLNDVFDSMKDTADKKGIKLSLDIPNGITDALYGTSTYVRKIFETLIENALKFSSEGEVHVEIQEKSSGWHGTGFCCSVSDQGIGIPLELQEKIFEPFVQVNSSYTRNYEGIGLGLAITKRMVELMGGTISVVSNVNAGSSFNFTFFCDVRNPQEEAA